MSVGFSQGVSDVARSKVVKISSQNLSENETPQATNGHAKCLTRGGGHFQPSLSWNASKSFCGFLSLLAFCHQLVKYRKTTLNFDQARENLQKPLEAKTKTVQMVLTLI